MEEENSNVQSSEVNETVNTETAQVAENNNAKSSNGAKNMLSNVLKNKKLLGIIAAVIVVVIALMVIVPNIVGGPKKAVKNFVSAMASGKSSKVMDAMDLKGVIALQKCSSGYYDLKVDESKFKDAYEDVDKDDVKKMKKEFSDSFDYEVPEKAKVKIVRFTEVKESKDCKKLYKVKAKIRTTYKDDDGDKQDTTSEMSFYVYKNKVIYINL